MSRTRWMLLASILVLQTGCLGPPRSIGGSSDPTKMSMEDLLDTKVVSAARHEQRIIDSPRSVSVVTAEDIRRNNWRTVPEALSELAGIEVQETNYGGGSPIIRGMIGNRILLLVDGVRISNSCYRLGPNQYLNTIDINQVDRIEVVRGSRSVLYGSDALGGLINVITRSREGHGEGTDLSLDVRTRYASADHGLGARAELSGRARNLGFTGGLSFKDFGDLRAGGAGRPQQYTGYGETDGDMKATWRLPGRQMLTLAYQNVRQTEVPRTDFLSSGSELKYEWDPQQRQMLYADYAKEREGRFIQSLGVRATWQSQLENLRRISRQTPDVESAYHNDVRTRGLTVQLGSKAPGNQILTWGGELLDDHVASDQIETDLLTRKQEVKSGTVANGADFESGALFLQDEFEIFRRLVVNLGLRHSRYSIDALASNTSTGAQAIRSRSHATTGSAFAGYRLRENLLATFGVGQGFRAPNVDDATILGRFASGFEVPNADLKPEEILTYEVGLKTEGRRFTGTIAGFDSRLRNLIERAPSSFNGLSYLDENGNGIEDSGEPDIYRRQNIGRARVYGVEMEAWVPLTGRWTGSAQASWLRGNDLMAGAPLTRMPPAHGLLGIRWSPAGDAWLEIQGVVSGSQRRLSPADRKDPRIEPGGTPGYATMNLRAGTKIPRVGEITLALENITDKNYRIHGSGFDAPGRNLIVGYRRSL